MQQSQISRSNESRFTMTGESRLAEKNALSRANIIKRVVMISSLKKQLKKILTKLIENGSSWLSDEIIERILLQTKSMLDNDRQKELLDDLHSIQSGACQLPYMMLRLVKHFVISPIEKNYIAKIEKEIKDDEDLQAEIKQAQTELEAQKQKRLQVYQLRKAGKLIVARSGTPSSREVQNYQNKLMRANQKLNQLSVNNNKLREKINQLRKQKNAMEDIYTKLKKQLEAKKENVENTIKFAGQAYCARNQAEQQLKNLKQKAQNKKQQFRQDCEKLNNQIQHDIRFKQFIKSKQIQKEQLQKLEEQIRQNQLHIELKKEQNSRIDLQYQKSMAKEIQIKNCFDRIKREVSISESNLQTQGKQLLAVFTGLYQKNAAMRKFVDDLNAEVAGLEDRIAQKKTEIQEIYKSGDSKERDYELIDQQVRKKYDFHQRKTKILQDQYQKSVQILQTIKQYLEQVFVEINVEPQIIQKLKNSSLSQENINQFLSELQRKGLQAISHYGSMVSEQLQAEKQVASDFKEQIEELNNIITLDNVSSTPNTTQNYKLLQYPTELLRDLRDDKLKQDDSEHYMTQQQLKRFALESLQHFHKRQTQKEKMHTKKLNASAAPLSKPKKK